jgi:predicted nucleic acid-binding protein
MLPPGFPRCRDPDDDHFLALAHHAAADALVSKDRAVLKLRRRARKFGVRILDVRQLNELAQPSE